MKLGFQGGAARCASVVAVLFMLAACSSAPVKRSVEQPPAPVARTVKPAGPPAPVLHENWEPAPQGGGYYLDDGPADLRPANLDQMPSAVPQVEPLAIRNTRPYTVMGQSFTPQTSLEEPYNEKGRASWYGRKFHGARTANGEIYDMHQMTAAHPTLPLPSYARVTNLENGRQVIVRVNDRGPFLRGRIIDLSYAAAFQLGYIDQGSAQVQVEKMTPEKIAQYHEEKRSRLAAKQPAGQVQQVAAPSREEILSASRQPLYLQIGAFGNLNNAQALLGQVNERHQVLGKVGQILSESGIHRVLIGPFQNVDQVNEAAIELSAVVDVQPVIKQDLIIP